MHVWSDFKQHLQALSRQVCRTELNASESSSRFWNRLNQIDNDRICSRHKDNWSLARAALGCHANGRGKCIEQCNLLLFQGSSFLLYSSQLTVHVADIQSVLLAFREAEAFQTFAQSLDDLVPGTALQNHPHFANVSSLCVSGMQGE